MIDMSQMDISRIKKEGIIVVSTFDGCAMAMQALKNLKIKVKKYYAYEIDKPAIFIANKKHKKIIQMGSIESFDYNLHKKEGVDLLIGGSPCQGFSFAGKQLNFEDPRSKLFFNYVDIKNEIKPTFFILENVDMKKEYLDVITMFMGVAPININSNLVSAQMRNRWYWTNIPGVSLPKDLNVKLQDILEEGFTDKMKSYCIDANYFKGGNPEQYFKKSRRQLVFNYSSSGRGKNKPVQGRFSYSEKALTLCAGGYSSRSTTGVMLDDMHWRKLTPIECERLQTLPDNYTFGVSNTQRYKMLGNGFTVKVIMHILKEMKKYIK